MTLLKELRGVLTDAHVPEDAYTLTEPGRAARQGHLEHLTTLDDLLGSTHALLTGLARRTHDTGGNYAGAEHVTTGAVRGIQVGEGHASAE